MCHALLLLVAVCAAAADNPLPNPGFDTGETLWALNDDSSAIVADAAHNGQAGLRVGAATYNPLGASVFSARLPVTPGQTVTITFSARTTAGCSGVYVYFYDAAGKTVTAPGGAQPVKVPDQTDGQWHEYRFEAVPPPGAARLGLWVHSFSGVLGAADYDDFALTGTAPGEPVPPLVRKPKPAPAIDPASLPLRDPRPLVVLKLDDFGLARGKVREVWRQLADLFAAQDVKGSFGVLGETLQEVAPEAAAWMKAQHDSGRVEFWFHGWDHRSHTVDGQACSEFYKRSYEDQRQRFEASERLSQEKLGFGFSTFGPPGGPSISWDAATFRVMADVPSMKVWLYAQPLDEPGRTLAAAGKVTILDRVWQANLESAVGVPDFKAFLAGYAANPQRAWFVLQGHPTMWNEGRYGEFLRILEFLRSQQAVFVTPTECARRLSGQG